jgi:hypothetical protein
VEVVLVHPVFVPFAFNFLRAVFAADLHVFVVDLLTV